ncbi:GDP-mannose dehydrogenase [Burkholderia ubonensis]|uniref:GDP-mannose dehydrogenase n=1 Tax=Burkholderia ubonensis TaxID=101571 RepID=A0AAW3MT26_9BURK|nr:nucleotide sugar dehydrogenase [Burkholderia ubonensis]KVP96770.1 GDP-mannose dehydrogenase [Burkholderia ubonensis]KVP98116.1 GDP-mannose dehydrogenase [Burkholderia ubonensis]KVZ92813.1 GDP-mannose dehydrogenase [Burkholderia ubonensis]
MNKTAQIAIIGLGYVGAPLALELAKHHNVVGFDINAERVNELRQGHDRTREMAADELNALLADNRLMLTAQADDLREADIFIVTVPTPVSEAHVPDMGCVLAASRTVGKVMKKGAIVVYESTVYPGATEEECLPVLQSVSGLNYPDEFAIGYSPERINPGDQVHRLTNTTKIVSGDRPEVLETLAALYGSITNVHRAPSIKVAEGAKVLENVQRDVNIALMNEAYQIFSRCGVDTHDVLEAAGTKWNFLKFTPGLVGGHCISVDPYYLSHKAASEGFQAKLIMSSRETNDSMPAFLVDQLVKKMVKTVGISRDTVVTVLGATFKENVPDVRNSKVADICAELDKYGVTVQVVDPLACQNEVFHELGVQTIELEDAEANPADAIILAVPHEDFLEEGGWPLIERLAKPEQALVMDFKAQLNASEAPAHLHVWR